MVVCGGVWWFAVVCGGLRWFVVVCGGLRWFVFFSHTGLLQIPMAMGDNMTKYEICTASKNTRDTKTQLSITYLVICHVYECRRVKLKYAHCIY